MLEFFANHEIDALVFAQNILTIGYEIDPPIEESGPTDNDARFPSVNELAEDDEVESNDSEYDVAGRSNEDDDADSDDNLLMSDYEEVPIERKHPTRFNIEDQRPYFSLRMTFANAAKVRESITKYCISRGVALKFVKNERNKIRVKCQDQCPFVLLVSKDNYNPRPVVKTLVLDHNCYRIFTNPRVSTTFLAQHYKTKFLKITTSKLRT